MTEPNTVEVSVILPAYNEGPAVRTAVERHVASLRRCSCSFEVIVVDDGSRDDTKLHAEEAARGNVEVRVVSNERNIGQAASLLRGYAVARGEVLLNNGVDLPFNPDDVGVVLSRVRQGADVVVVERTNRQAYGIWRKVVSWSNILLVKVLLRSPFVDHNFVQAYRRFVVEAITVESRGVSTVTLELILKARALGFAMDRISLPYARRQSGKSTITLGQIVYATSELFRLALIMRRFRREISARHVSARSHSQSHESSGSPGRRLTPNEESTAKRAPPL